MIPHGAKLAGDRLKEPQEGAALWTERSSEDFSHDCWPGRQGEEKPRRAHEYMEMYRSAPFMQKGWVRSRSQYNAMKCASLGAERNYTESACGRSFVCRFAKC